MLPLGSAAAASSPADGGAIRAAVIAPRRFRRYARTRTYRPWFDGGVSCARPGFTAPLIRCKRGYGFILHRQPYEHYTVRSGRLNIIRYLTRRPSPDDRLLVSLNAITKRHLTYRKRTAARGARACQNLHSWARITSAVATILCLAITLRFALCLC